MPFPGVHPDMYKLGEFEKYRYFISRDLIYGNLNTDSKIIMSEVLTQRPSTNSRRNKTIFQGIYAVVKAPKNLDVRIYIRRDIKDKDLLNKPVAEKLPFDNLRISTDSQEFEKMFDVYSSDKIIAMQILTADVMQQLMNFQREMNMDYELTIKNNCIFIRFMAGEMFEAVSIDKPVLDKETLYKYYKILDFTFSLSTKLINIIDDLECDYQN